jgi:LEA14-like dessication related protein
MGDLLLVGGLILAWVIFGNASTVNNLVFVPTGAGFDISSPLSPIINVTVNVQNPTSGSLQLNSFAGTASVNGTASGNVSYFQPTVIAANAQTQIVVQVRLSDLGLIAALMNFINAGTGAIAVSIVGTANVNGAALPVNISLNASV